MHYIIGFSVLGALAMAALLLVYYHNPHRPDIERYIREGTPAFDSPGLAGTQGTFV